MTKQVVTTITTKGGILKVWNDKKGTIWYRYKKNESEKIDTYMIREYMGKYAITPTDDENNILYKGTKKNCLTWMIGYIEISLNN